MRAVAAGFYFSLALKNDGTVWSWGYNYGGLLGLGNQDGGIYVPAQIPGLAGIKAIATGASHSLALAGDGTLRAFGGNGAGQLGDGTTTDRYSPVTVAGALGRHRDRRGRRRTRSP